MELENIEPENTKWNYLIHISNAEYSIVTADKFLELSYLKSKKNKYQYKIYSFYKKMYELANYFAIDWCLIYEDAYKLATIYADYNTEGIINEKTILDVLHFSHQNNFSVVFEYYITIFHICLMTLQT